MVDAKIIQIPDHERLSLALKRRYIDNGLRYGWPSHNRKNYDFGQWFNLLLMHNPLHPIDLSTTPFIKSHPVVKEIWDKISNIDPKPRMLVEAYVNGYAYGNDAYAHVDTPGLEANKDNPNYSAESMIFYINDFWHKDWAGETVIFDEEGDIVKSVLPKPGRVLIFDSTQYHCARPVTRACPELRKAFVMKALPLELESTCARWVLNNTKGIQFGSISLYEALYSISSIIGGATQYNRDLTNAGLFLQIYGSELFNFYGGFDRSVIREMIGERAEYLVYEFGRLENRRRTLEYNINKYDENTLDDLRLLEWANQHLFNGNPQSYEYFYYLSDNKQKICVKREYAQPRTHKLKTYDFTKAKEE